MATRIDANGMSTSGALGHAGRSTHTKRAGFMKVKATAICLAVFTPGIVHAYVGPGSGLAAMGTLLAVVLALVLAIAGFVWYPVKRLWTQMKHRLRKRAEGTETEASVDTPENAA